MVFTKAETDSLTAEQTHEAFQMLCNGVPVDEIRAAVLHEKKEEPKPTITQQQCQDKAMEIASRLAQSQQQANRALSYYIPRR